MHQFNCPGFDPSIRRHSGIWGAPDEAVLTIVHCDYTCFLEKEESEITLQDILGIVDSRLVVLKVDVEGMECKVKYAQLFNRFSRKGSTQKNRNTTTVLLVLEKKSLKISSFFLIIILKCGRNLFVFTKFFIIVACFKNCIYQKKPN